MAERLAKGTFDKLAKSIWRIGQLGMKDVIEAAPIPCLIQKDFRFLRDILGVQLDLVADPVTERPKPVWMAATFTEVAPYVPEPELDIYTFETLALDLRRRRKEFETGIYLSDDKGLTITVYPGGAGDIPEGVTEARWEQLVGGNSRSAFGEAQAADYLARLGGFANLIRQQH